MEKITIGKNSLRIGASVLAVLILATAFWLGRATTRQAQAEPPVPTTGSAAPSAADAGPFTCTIDNIAVFSNRIHVHCTTVVSGTSIAYFVAQGDSAHALTTNRILMLLNTAFSLNKPIYIYYLASSASNPPGCNTNDCRAIDWVFIH